MSSARCTAVCAVLIACTGLPFVHGKMPGDAGPDIRAILKEASQIAIRQDAHEGYWCDRTLVEIARVQKRAGDFDGALRTMTKSNDQYGRIVALNDLAKTLARAGRRSQAFAVLRQMGTDHGWRQDLLDDGVTMAYLEHQIVSGHLQEARQSIDQLTAGVSRPSGLVKLAVALTKSGNTKAANTLFQRALATATALPDEYDRARTLWEIADAQIAIGDVKAASSTIQQLSEHAASFEDGWAKVAALREAAVRAAKIGDRTAAKHLFGQAIDGRKSIRPPSPLPAINRMGALNMIAKAQATVGYIDDAINTTRLIKHSEDDFTPDGRREEALCAIAVARARAGDIAGAVATEHSIKYYVQYKTDILVEIANLQIRHGELKESLATAAQIANPSKQATACLNVAIAYAKAGDGKTAKTIARRIHVARQGWIASVEPVEFDYGRPRTWGIMYQASGTMASQLEAIRRAADLAAAAMTLTQVLGKQYPESYAIMFRDFRYENVVRALARAHAASGDANEALVWAHRIGSNEKIESREDFAAIRSVKSRIYALLGVAEGILAKRQSQQNTHPTATPGHLDLSFLASVARRCPSRRAASSSFALTPGSKGPVIAEAPASPQTSLPSAS